MDECVGRSRLMAVGDEEVRLPVAYLVCNQTPPLDDRPSLMSFDEVMTLFHEFGHGLQHMLTTVDYGLASGIRNVEWDAVELPSQFMENWCYQRETLLGLLEDVESAKIVRLGARGSTRLAAWDRILRGEQLELPPSFVLSVKIADMRFSGDIAEYPLWPNGEKAFVFDPVAAVFYGAADGGTGWRREAYDLVSVPPSDTDVRRFTSVDGLGRGR